MKKINSIEYSTKILGTASVFTFAVPLILKCISFVISINALDIIGHIAIFIGLIIFIAFFIYLFIELKQDKKIDQFYSKNKNRKVLMGDGHFECSVCGNRKVTKEDTYCRVCGITFCKVKDLSPHEIINK